jgi:transposase InsO family protein
MEIVTKCMDCQFFHKQITKHVNHLRLIDLSYSFAIWGINIMGALPGALGWFIFLFATIDTFTKWMEAGLVVNITQEAVVKFLQSIIFRFGVRKWILTNNDTQFKGTKFVRCHADFGINHQASSAAHPQTNC